MVRWHLAHGRYLDLGPRSVLVGVLNVTPDSFSDGGEFDDTDRAIAQAERLVREGAAIIDVGGESTRPGAESVPASVEQQRILPVIEALARRDLCLLSVDTFRAETARLAIAAGAHLVNDVHGLQREGEIARIAAETGAGIVIMHTGRDRQKLDDVIADQFLFLERSIAIARQAGVEDARIVLDPGFGFAKDEDENFRLMARFSELRAFGFPLMAGTSRKRMIGHIAGADRHARDLGTAATSVILRMQGASLFRVHDVATNRLALDFADAVLEAGRE